MIPVVVNVIPSPNPEYGYLQHYVANPLTLRVSATAAYPIAGEDRLWGEIRQSPTDTTGVKASSVVVTPTGPGPWSLAFSDSQLKQPLGGAAYKDYWIVIYTSTSDGEVQTLKTYRLRLVAHNASLVADDPPLVAFDPDTRNTFTYSGNGIEIAGPALDVSSPVVGPGLISLGWNGLDFRDATDERYLIAGPNQIHFEPYGPNDAPGSRARMDIESTDGGDTVSITLTGSDSEGSDVTILNPVQIITPSVTSVYALPDNRGTLNSSGLFFFSAGGASQTAFYPADPVVLNHSVGATNTVIINNRRVVLLTATLTGATTYWLPSASLYPAGQTITFVDTVGGISSANPAVLDASLSGQTINGASSLSITEPYASVVLVSNGSNKWSCRTPINTLINSGVTAGTYGSSSVVPVVTVNAKGIVTSITPAAFGAAALSGTTLASGVTASSLTSAAGGAFGTGAFNPLVTRATLGLATTDSPTFTGITASGVITASNGINSANDINLVTGKRLGLGNGVYFINLLNEAGSVDQVSTSIAQRYRAYNTYTDASNYERATFGFTSNVLRIGTEHLGTGTARALEFITSGTTRVTIASNGFVTVAGSMLISGNIQLGGSTSSFPQIKRTGAAISFRLADDTADANISAAAATFTALNLNGSPVGNGFQTDATTAHSLVLADGGFLTDLTNAAGCVITVPTNATLALPIGFEASFIRGTTAGVPTASIAGVTLRNAGALSLVPTDGVFMLKKLLTDTWIVV